MARGPRNVEVAAVFGGWRRAGLEADVGFNQAARLPGGAREITLVHYAIDGLMLDWLTR